MCEVGQHSAQVRGCTKPIVHPVCRTRTSLGKPYRLSTLLVTPILVLPRRPTGHAKEWMPPYNWRITSTIILPSIPDCRHLCNLWIFLHLSVVPVCSTTSPILTGTLVAGKTVGHTAENLHSTEPVVLYYIGLQAYS